MSIYLCQRSILKFQSVGFHFHLKQKEKIIVQKTQPTPLSLQSNRNGAGCENKWKYIEVVCFVQQGHSSHVDKILVSWLLFILSVSRSRPGAQRAERPLKEKQWEQQWKSELPEQREVVLQPWTRDTLVRLLRWPCPLSAHMGNQIVALGGPCGSCTHQTTWCCISTCSEDW